MAAGVNFMSHEFISIPPAEILRRYFRVDSEGRIHRKMANYGWKQVSRIRGGQKYSSVHFECKSYLTHRLVWAIHHGRSPVGMVDHINGNKWDNRAENLREATASQNRWNRPVCGTNRTGFKGVFAVKGGYRGRTVFHYKPHLTPTFHDPELAELAVSVLRDRLHGDFAWSDATWQ